MIKYFQKEDGSFSWTNIFNLLVALLAGFAAISNTIAPFIPAKYAALFVAIVALVNVALRTFQTNGSPIVK